MAFSHPSGSDGDQLIRETDTAMYLAKSRGKNSYELAHASGEEGARTSSTPAPAI